jgi:hypothetical protein
MLQQQASFSQLQIEINGKWMYCLNTFHNKALNDSVVQGIIDVASV